MKLSVHQLSKSFCEQRVLREISFTISDAKCVACIGPSGGGKSTLLRILAGLETPDAGEIVVSGERLIFEQRALRAYRRTIGVVFQAYNLFPHLSALANVALPLEKVHGFSAADARTLAMQALSRFRLESHAEKKPSQLSGGQKQRVAIARAIAMKPRLIFLDEPTSALDPEMTAEVLELIAELKTEGAQLFLVTHEMGFARQISDKILFLANGEVGEQGASAQIFEQPKTESCRAFLSRILKY